MASNDKQSAEDTADILATQNADQGNDLPSSPVEVIKPRRKLSSGLQRLLTGVVLLAIVVVFLAVLRPLCIHSFDILGMFFVITGCIEMRRALQHGGHRIMLVPMLIFFILIYPLFWFFQTEGIMIAFALSAACALGIFTFKHAYSVTDMGLSILTVLYPGVFVAMIMAINLYAGDLLAILVLLAVPLASDACAYFVGSKFGKHKLCPEISPKKSVEGLVGGVIGALLVGVALLLVFDVFHLLDNVANVRLTKLSTNIGVSVVLYFVLCLLAMVGGMAGDLVASWIKRQVGIKDYGRIFPGHGGVMDRMDSVIFAMPVVYLFFTIYNAVLPLV